MSRVHIDDLIRLTMDVPEMYLHRGDVGVVRSTWFEPTTAYEVEFEPPGLSCITRAVLLREQFQVEATAQAQTGIA